MTELQVIGAGGHAKVIVALAEAAGYCIAGIYDDRPLPLPDVLGHQVRGPVNLVTRAPHIPAVLAIGSNVARAHLDAKFPSLQWATLVHPTAWVAPTAQLGAGTVVMAGAVVQPDALLGRHVIVNTAASVDHDARLGNYVHLAPGSRLAGSVMLDDGVFLGTAAAVLPGRSVGEWSVVGAGAVVSRDVPANVTAVGVPARVIKEREPGWHRL